MIARLLCSIGVHRWAPWDVTPLDLPLPEGVAVVRARRCSRPECEFVRLRLERPL